MIITGAGGTRENKSRGMPSLRPLPYSSSSSLVVSCLPARQLLNGRDCDLGLVPIVVAVISFEKCDRWMMLLARSCLSSLTHSLTQSEMGESERAGCEGEGEVGHT